MLKNYLITTLRSFRKNKIFSFVNIFGLASGLTAAIFILQYSFFELGFDRFHENSDELYRVINKRYEGDRLIQESQITYSAVGQQMQVDFPEVIENCRTMPARATNIQHDGKVTRANNTLFADPSFLTMFSFELLAGNRETALSEFRSIVITESVARRVFEYQGNDFDQFIGEMVKLDKDESLSQVTGILKDMPANSSIQVDVLMAYSSLTRFYKESDFSWLSSDFYHYIQLSPHVDVNALEAKFEDFSERYFKGDEITGNFEEFYLQPVKSMHLDRGLQYEYIETNDSATVYTLILVAVFILLMAWINYVNLTTSRSLERAKEVGLRKVIGGERKQLIFQFFTEALIMNVLAAIVAYTLVQIFQIGFNQLVEQELSLSKLATSSVLNVPAALILVALLIVGTFLSGLYPAIILSNYKPIVILKGNFKNSNSGSWLRKSLVVFQFAISSLLIAGTYTVYRQINFMRAQDLGVNLDQVMVVNGPELVSFDSTFIKKANDFKSMLMQNPRVLSAANSENVPGETPDREFNVRKVGTDERYMFNRINVDHTFVEQYEIEVLAGRDLEYRDHNPEGGILNKLMVNESAAKMLGFNTLEEVVNQKIEVRGNAWTIIGVLKDFHQTALINEIEPLLFFPFMSPKDRISIRVASKDIGETVDFVKASYESFYPNNSFEYFFLDDRFDQQYRNDERFGRVFNLFSILVIIIASLGLFGLTAYNSIQRSKEIGVRKVLGASSADILRLLSKDFLVLIGVANLIALPLVYYGAKQWLQGYAYAINPGFWLFLIPLAVVFIVALATIAMQTLKSARSNPVDALKYE